MEIAECHAKVEIKSETVDHPPHYGGDATYEHIKVVEAWDLGYVLGNATKYICRAEKKGQRLEDLKKARWYLDYEIQRLENLKRLGFSIDQTKKP